VFKKQKKGDNSYDAVLSKEEKIHKSELEMKKTKDMIAKHLQDQQRLDKEIREQQKEKDSLSGDMKKMRSVGN
jgi:hypothetical protein